MSNSNVMRLGLTRILTLNLIYILTLTQEEEAGGVWEKGRTDLLTQLISGIKCVMI